MKCKICGAESGKYPLCRACNLKKERGEVIKCTTCGNWHYTDQPCPTPPPPTDDVYLYALRNTLISRSEQGFYVAIKASVPEGFCVFPQINLASFIERTDDARFRNELFRNVDFLVTDSEYQPKFVVEINDQTHLTTERKERDEKVRKICEEAGIPILKLWTSYGVNTEYIKGRITEILSSLPIKRVHHFDQAPLTQQEPPTSDSTPQTKKQGCYIATCVYGSYDHPSVWVLRRYRDQTLYSTWYGRVFIKLYYAVSPSCVKWFGDRHWFKTICKTHLDTIVNNLQDKGFDSAPYDDLY